MGFNTSWLLNYKAENEQSFLIFSGVFFFVLILIPVLSAFFYKPQLEVAINYKYKWIRLLSYCGLLGFMVLFSRWQFLPVLGSRLLYLFVLIALIVGTVYLIIYKLTVYKKIYYNEQQEKILNKYRP